MEFEEKLKYYWVEMDDANKPIFLFVNPNAEGMCYMIQLLRGQVLIQDPVKVYYNNCRNITQVEYVTYRLLGYLDG